MRRRTHAGAGIAVFTGIIPDQLHKLRQRFGRNLWVDHHDVRRNRNQCHGGEILDRIVGQLGVEAGVHQKTRADRHDGVAVGCHARDLAGRGVAACATDVLDKELLAESVGKRLRHEARDDVGRAAGRKVLTIAITFGVSIGFAVLGAIVVAQRFIERHEGDRQAFPPIAELILAALIVAGLSIAVRIGVPLVPALMQGQGFQDVLNQFADRLPGTITPFTCTISLGLLCSYLGSVDWRWYHVLGVGALGNGLALMGAGWLVGSLLGDTVLAQFYLHPEHAVRIIALSTGSTGFMVGAMVLAVFNKSERVRKDTAERAAEHPHTDIPLHHAPSLAEDLEVPLPSRSEAANDLGCYSRASVEALEGRYVCFRPAFSSADVINAYLMSVHWDETASCLMFEERERVDAGHTQKGRVYIPDGRPFMSFVTVERGRYA
jgi:hypothetical protein